MSKIAFLLTIPLVTIIRQHLAAAIEMIGRITRSVFVLLVMIVASATTSDAQLDTLSHDGLVRDYIVHLPPSYDGLAPTPVVIAFHGGFGSAENIENQSGLSEVSDEEGFIVVYPNGTGGIQTWNGGECCGSAANQDIDDVGFIDKLIDRLDARYNIELNEVYATGISNGAAMSYRLACELSDRIAAIAPVAATYRNESCQPSRPVPVVHFHSVVDSNVPIEGGVGDGPSNLNWIALDSTLANFAAINDCATSDSSEVSSSLLLTIWSGCGNGEAMKYYRTADGGHSWPGGTKTFIGDTVSTAVDASREMWSFFEQFEITSLSTDDSQPNQSKLSIRLYPNPTAASTTLSIAVPDLRNVSMNVYDLLGRSVGISENLTDSQFQVELPTESLARGVYLVRVKSRYGTESILLIKQ